MNLTTFSIEQLNLFQHTVDGIMRQLEDINPGHLPEEDTKQHETILQQAYVFDEQLTLEIARRSLLYLQVRLVEDRPLNLCPYCREQGTLAPSEQQNDETFLIYHCPNEHTFYVKREAP